MRGVSTRKSCYIERAGKKEWVSEEMMINVNVAHTCAICMLSN